MSSSQVQRGRQLPHYRGNRPIAFASHMPFDPICCPTIFPGADFPKENEVLSKILMDVHSRLAPSVEEQQAVASLVTKVLECLESIALDKGRFNLGHIEETRSIGSFKKGTMLAGHCLADIVVVLRELPTFEVTRAVGIVLRTAFLDKETGVNGDLPECVERPYGFDFTYLGAGIRVAFATLMPTVISDKLKAGTYVSDVEQSVSRAAIFHSRWAEEKANHPNVKALVRILKDFRRRFMGFNYLSPWQIDLLAFYAVMQNPTGTPLPLSVAFRRVIQMLAAGLFLPGSAGFIDPTSEPTSRRVHVSLTLSQQDELCRFAQVMARLLGLERFTVLFADLHPARLITLDELVEAANTLPGVKLQMSESVCSTSPSHSTEPQLTPT